MWGPLLAWIRLQIGQRTDAASATGSLHAKVKDTKDYLASKDIIANGSVIKSVQRGTINVKNESTTATISAVTTSKSVVTLLGFTAGDSAVYSRMFPRVTLTDSTTVTAVTRTVDASTDIYVNWQVVEYY